MIKRTALFSVLLIALYGHCYAQNTDDILNKYFEANRITKMASVNSVTVTGKITGTIINGASIEYSVRKLRPYKQCMELNNRGEISKTVFDGRSEWVISKGKTVKNPYDVEEQRKRKICFEGDIFYCKNNGYLIEYNGIVNIEGIDLYLIKITNKDDFDASYYIDPGSFMLLKSVEGSLITYYSNFKSVDGIIFPFSIKIITGIKGEFTELNIDKIELNNEIEPSVFTK